jgi:Zn-dependent peptidase ImmA (M78 family)
MIKLARHAVRSAMKLRSELGYTHDQALCPFDVAEAIAVSVRLVAANTLEGVYFPPPVKQIFVGARRPLARQRFTCAHEIAHHLYGHGQCIATIGDFNERSDEFLANRFAAALLMPKLAILGAFQRYAADPSNPKPIEVWRVAQALGVGYETLAQHMNIVLQAYSSSKRDELLKVKPAKLRTEALGFPLSSGNCWVVDSAWGERSVDINIGDVLRIPAGCSLPLGCFSAHLEHECLYEAVAQGETAVFTASNKALVHVRVSKKDFEGLAQYRYLSTEPDDAQ